MDRRRMNRVTLGFIAIVVLILVLMISGSMRPTEHITLPSGTDSGSEDTDDKTNEDALSVVEITPETVQAAIATLARPEAYRRTVQIQQFWKGGSGGYDTTVTVAGSWTRTDRLLPGDRTRHTITNGETTWIWYDNSDEMYVAPAGTISADNEQGIPTYEEILELPVETIAEADYRAIADDIPCIYVETAVDASGYSLRYWVSVETGLLVAAEKLADGETVYRMSSLNVDLSAPERADFQLPDGSYPVSGG